MTVYVAPDVEGCLMDYLKAHALVLASPCAGRVFLAVGNTPTFPYVRVVRFGGGEDGSDAPIDNGLVQIDVFGRVRELAEAEAVKRAVRQALSDLNYGGATIAGKGRLLGAVVRDDRRLPLSDEQDGTVVGERPRFALTVGVSCVAVDA